MSARERVVEPKMDREQIDVPAPWRHHHHDHEQLQGKCLLPPKDDGKPTLVLHLDQTLVSCTYTEPFSSWSVWPWRSKSPKAICNGCSSPLPVLRVTKRPHVDDFLKTMAEIYEIVVFTSENHEYADAVVDVLDPHGQLISHRLYMQHCSREAKNECCVNLKMLGRDLRRVVIVDDHSSSFCANPENGLKIHLLNKFDAADNELAYLAVALSTLAEEEDEDLRKQIETQNDVRKMIKEVFQEL